MNHPQDRQQSSWEKEYRVQKLLSPSNVPQADVMRFVRWMKKAKRKQESRLEIEGLHVLDLGSGTGRNSYYFASEGAIVTGYEFSPTALAMAKHAAQQGGLDITYRLQDIGMPYSILDESIDIVLDVTSSNSLSDAARANYVKEIKRVLKPGGFLFLRALSLEKDSHAKQLVKKFPGPDPDTYIHPDLHFFEKVFSREALKAAYESHLKNVFLDRVEHYATVSGTRYKRSYWIAYFQKPEQRRESGGD